MAYHCTHCGSLFLKTLELRIRLDVKALLYKKRCKRCKFKHLLQRTSPHAPLEAISHAIWQQAQVVPGTQVIASQAHTSASEYTQRVRQAAESALPYLKQLQTQRDATPTVALAPSPTRRPNHVP